MQQDNPSGYGWADSFALRGTNAFANADSYSLLGIVFQALQRGYALDRGDVKSGKLKRYRGIPKTNIQARSLSPDLFTDAVGGVSLGNATDSYDDLDKDEWETDVIA